MTDLDALMTADRATLLEAWQRLVGRAPPPHLSLPLMRRILGHEIQCRRQGGLSRRTRTALGRRGKGTARPATPGLKPGARLLRQWQGVTHVVDVTDQGFLWNGTTYRSLSAIARAITGARWSGPRFFGLTESRS